MFYKLKLSEFLYRLEFFSCILKFASSMIFRHLMIMLSAEERQRILTSDQVIF